MAKTRTTKKKPAKKTAKKAAPRKKKTSTADLPLPPKQRAKVLRKLRKMSIPPSHPSSITGPALTLGYDAPLPRKKAQPTKKKEKPAKRRKRS
jgi:hypothetical protein